jgi:hypothetical protein
MLRAHPDANRCAIKICPRADGNKRTDKQECSSSNRSGRSIDDDVGWFRLVATLQCLLVGARRDAGGRTFVLSGCLRAQPNLARDTYRSNIQTIKLDRQLYKPDGTITLRIRTKSGTHRPDLVLSACLRLRVRPNGSAGP